MQEINYDELDLNQELTGSLSGDFLSLTVEALAYQNIHEYIRSICCERTERNEIYVARAKEKSLLQLRVCSALALPALDYKRPR